MKALVTIIRRPEIADPEGATVSRALHDLGFAAVTGVRFGRTSHLDVAEDDPVAARAMVVAMCEKLLANPVIEDYTVDIAPGDA